MPAKTSKTSQEHLLIVEDEKGRRSVTLSEEVYSVGRDRSCDIHLSSQFVSRRHATLKRDNNADGGSVYRILDGDGAGKPSVNGLVINGRKASDHVLKHSDEIVFGPQVFAIYQSRQHEAQASGAQEDPFDITLIDPAMMMGDGDDLMNFDE
ncbi:MAG: FHA domain-containing protein [Spirulinaceae cyanobacterium SM2_1_0]|nr:FHA domain-containing protein [Spirulinaceae cyanobacterium SM2_1_0]